MALIYITLGLLAEHFTAHGSLHTFGVIDVWVGVVILVWSVVTLLGQLAGLIDD